jgi:uncharacterized membrane protein YfcA
MTTLLLLGMGVGLILALTGAGGSIIAMPMLMFGMGWSVAEAGPVALLAVACSATVGALIGLKMRQVRYRAALLISACGIPFTPVGLMAARALPETVLTVLFALLLLGVSIRSMRQARAAPATPPTDPGACVAAPCLLDPATGRLAWTGRCGRALSIAGVGTGFLSGLFGVGGGFFVVPVLQRFTDLSMNSVIATSMMVVALVSTGAATVAAVGGHLPWDSGWPFALGAIGGMAIGRLAAKGIPSTRLSFGFALVCSTISVVLLIRVAYAAL